jgi:hypothetical protein
MLCRIPETEEDLLPDRIAWPDNPDTAWYYLAVNEATNSHTYKSKKEVYEEWNQLIADEDWTKYQ